MADIQAKRLGRSIAVEAKLSSLEVVRVQTAEMIQEVMAATPDTYHDGDFMFKEAFNETV